MSKKETQSNQSGQTKPKQTASAKTPPKQPASTEANKSASPNNQTKGLSKVEIIITMVLIIMMVLLVFNTLVR